MGLQETLTDGKFYNQANALLAALTALVTAVTFALYQTAGASLTLYWSLVIRWLLVALVKLLEWYVKNRPPSRDNAADNQGVIDAFNAYRATLERGFELLEKTANRVEPKPRREPSTADLNMRDKYPETASTGLEDMKKGLAKAQGPPKTDASG